MHRVRRNLQLRANDGLAQQDDTAIVGASRPNSLTPLIRIGAPDVVPSLAGQTQGRSQDGAGVGSLDGGEGAVQTVQATVGKRVGTRDVRGDDGEGPRQIRDDGPGKGVVRADGDLHRGVADRSGFGS